MTKRKRPDNVTMSRAFCKDLTTGESYDTCGEFLYNRREVDGKKVATVDLAVTGPMAYHTRLEARDVEILYEDWIGAPDAE